MWYFLGLFVCIERVKCKNKILGLWAQAWECGLYGSVLRGVLIIKQIVAFLHPPASWVTRYSLWHLWLCTSLWFLTGIFGIFQQCPPYFLELWFLPLNTPLPSYSRCHGLLPLCGVWPWAQERSWIKILLQFAAEKKKKKELNLSIFF
jgi:hypothetical protein